MNDSDPVATLLPYRAEILSHAEALSKLPGSSPLQQLQVLQNMVITTMYSDVTEESYLEILQQCKETGNYERIRKMYNDANVPELESIADRQGDTITDQMRNAAINLLGYMKGTQRGIEQTDGEVTVADIGFPPNFQIPDWLFAFQEVAHANPELSLADIVHGLDEEPESPQGRRIGSV